MFKLGIATESDLNELRKLAKLFASDGKLPNENLLEGVFERLASYGDDSALLFMGAKCHDVDARKSAEYYYRAFCRGVTLRLNIMMECAKVFEQAQQMEKAIALYEKCAREGNDYAIRWLGNYWYGQMKLKKNENALGSWRHLSHRWDEVPYGARLDEIPSCFDWRNSYYQKSTAYENAVHWLEMSASNNGDAEVFMKLSLLHDGKQRIDDLRNALKKGSEVAAFELGVIYDTGLGDVVKNKAEAKRLYLIAAEKGSSEALLPYAYLLDSPQEAWDWVRKAAEQGNVEAQYQFGRLNDFNGWGAWSDGRHWKYWCCTRDYHSGKQIITPGAYCENYKNNAIKWYRLATKNGHKEAERELAKHDMPLE